MDFSSRDMGILIAMSLAVISISFVFPSLGLTGEQASQPPDFEIQGDRFNFSGEFPDRPGTPTTGTLTNERGDDDVWLEGDEQAGVLLAMSGDIVQLSAWEDGSLSSSDESLRFEGEGETYTVNNTQYEIDVTATEYNSEEFPALQEVDYEIIDQPDSNGGWVSRIPVIGGAVGAGDGLISTLAWLGSVIWWFCVVTIEVATNAIGAIVDVSVFAFNLTGWLTNTYLAVIGGANGFASVFVSVPGIILSLVILKLMMALTSLLPTT